MERRRGRGEEKKKEKKQERRRAASKQRNVERDAGRREHLAEHLVVRRVQTRRPPAVDSPPHGHGTRALP